MLIINADDFGRSRLATDNIIAGFRRGLLTSTSAMVFMKDSLRGAEISKEYGIDVGLHLNFSERIDHDIDNRLYVSHHNRIMRYLNSTNISYLIYNHGLRQAFDYVYHSQLEEFVRIFGAVPTHFDGHHHMHLCANMMINPIIQRAQIVRRSFTYAPGEKSLLKRTFYLFIDKILEKRYIIVDYLFSLEEKLEWGRLNKDLDLAKDFDVELQTHPEIKFENQWLSGHEGMQLLHGPKKGNFSFLKKNAAISQSSPA